MTPALRSKIDELIALDNDRHAENEKEKASGKGWMERVLDKNPSPLLVALDKLEKDELAFVMALMWFGRGDGIAEEGATFESVLEYAKSRHDESTACYVYEKPLGDYLPRGLARLGFSV